MVIIPDRRNRLCDVTEFIPRQRGASNQQSQIVNPALFPQEQTSYRTEVELLDKIYAKRIIFSNSLLVKGRNVKNQGRFGDPGGTVRGTGKLSLLVATSDPLGFISTPFRKGKGNLKKKKKWDQTLGVTKYIQVAPTMK